MVAALVIPTVARATGSFDYKMQVTPEEGPLNPKVESRYTAAFSQCQKRVQVTSENAACFEAELQRQDAQLNKAWRSTLPRFSPEMRRSLLEAQRKWIRERDPFCMKNSDGFSGGTIAPVVYVSCRVELTIRRTIWLEQLR